MTDSLVVPAGLPADSGARKRRRPPDIAAGIAVLRDHLRALPGSPGVYRMIDAGGEVLYVGKARNLKKRVNSYTSAARLPHRLFRMVAETASLEVVTTHTEVEALLLESNLIKRLRPRYNVLLRDDKSFAHILVTGGHAWPRIEKHRGARTREGDYFGPFASAGAVNRTIAALQRAFLLRNCSDSVFAARTRPCLQYQIKRCAAPCVGLVSEAGYGELVADAKSFLRGDSQAVQRALAARMQEASDALAFETAAIYRNRIRALTAIQARQGINIDGVVDADAIALHAEGGASCIQIFFFRGGSNYGNRAYFPSHDRELEESEILAAFIGQFYDNKPPPPLLLVSHAMAEAALIGEALSTRAGRRVRLVRPQRGGKRRLLDHALANAREALARRQAESASQRKLLEGVARTFRLDAPPRRIEVFDNSHIQGRSAVGAMIVAGPDGLVRSAYRKFNIRHVVPASQQGAQGGDAEGGETPSGEIVVAGDDYAMMRQVLHRRFARALREDPDRSQADWPDLVLIDGGPGQLSGAGEVMQELGLPDIALAAISKGPDRDAGRERFHLAGRAPFRLDRGDPVLYFLQRLRDEAHRFAIETHRARRASRIGRSAIDEIRGIGPRRKRALLHHFGSARAVERAGLHDLEAVAGISRTVAKRIYDHFHESREMG